MVTDTTQLQSMSLLRKYRISQIITYPKRAIGGKFQGANLPDFRDSTTLYTLRDTADMSYHIQWIDHQEQFKYVRYLSAIRGGNNMAEAEFFSDGQLLQGEVVGTDGKEERPFTYENGKQIFW